MGNGNCGAQMCALKYIPYSSLVPYYREIKDKETFHYQWTYSI